MVRELDKLGYGEIGWLAGWLEGEGSFRLRKNRTEIKSSSTDEDIVRRVYETVGGSINGPYQHGVTIKNEAKKAYWTWSISGDEARKLMTILYPLMGNRRQETIKYILTTYNPNKMEEYRERMRGTSRPTWSTARRASYEAKRRGQ